METDINIVKLILRKAIENIDNLYNLELSEKEFKSDYGFTKKQLISVLDKFGVKIQWQTDIFQKEKD